MIIELFGPPGAGKTTFARALATHIRGTGQTIDLWLSYRPAENSPGTEMQDHRASPVLRRLARPLAETLTLARHPITLSLHLGAAHDLIKTMPPSQILWRLRLAQYLSRLSRAWSQALAGEHIVLFDQAFVQAVCSLALLCESSNEGLISRALDKIPKSDLLVLIQAPKHLLESRLCHRHQHASRMERLLELDLATNLKSTAIIDSLLQLLPSKGRQVAIVASLDQYSLQDGLKYVERQVSAQFNEQRRVAKSRKAADISSRNADQQLVIPTQSLVEEG